MTICARLIQRFMLRKIFILASISVGCFISSNVRAQRYTFIQYSLKEGLVQSQVRCLMQDRHGFIWAGTLGGLSKFDGRIFQNYDRNSGLINNQINCILELSDGTIAVGSNGSVSFINGLGVTSVALEGQWKEATINALFQNEDDLLIGTELGLLSYSLTQKNFASNPISHDELSKEHIKAIFKSTSGRLFFLTKEKLWTDDQKGISVFYAPQNAETNFFDIDETSDGTLWLATKGEGLVSISSDSKVVKNYLDDPQLTSNTLTNLISTPSNELWMTSRFGFFHYDGKNFEGYSENNGLPTPDVRDVLLDRDGNIWLATYGYGLQKFTGDVFSTYNKDDGLSSDAVMSILQDERGDMWFSTFDNGICKTSNDTIVKFNLKELSSNSRIWTSIRTKDNSLWFGSSHGLFRYSNGSFKRYTELDSLNDRLVLSLFEDSEGRIWVGTAKGVTLYENEKFASLKNSDAPKKRIRCIREDKSGAIWLASIEGVYKYENGRFTVYSQKDGLAENSAFCLEVDDYNRIWVGTQNGISLLIGTQFVSIGVDGVSSSNVINFLKYKNQTLWVGTNNGLYSAFANESVSEKNITFIQYSLEDGLRSLETNLNSAFFDNKDRLWFGTTEGAVTLIPDKLIEKRKIVSKAPLISLSKIQINLQDQDWSKTSKDLNPLTGLINNPIFTYRQNHLTFYFTGISTTYPDALEYQFRLEGFDDDWRNVSDRNSATYSNLPYRDFVFQVKAKNKEGVWSEVVAYPFSVKPPFWLTWWFIVLEVLLVSTIVGYIIYNRRKVIKEKREKEWFEVKSKMLALEQQSLNSSMNRHFIFNALNSIQYYINRQDRMSANRYLSDFAKLIRKNLDNTQENLTTLRDEIERLELYLKLEHMRFKDKFDYHVDVDSNLNIDEIKVPPMLVQPFLENSIWHGLLPKEEMGEVRLNIFKNEGRLEFSVTDNGVGIENSLKNKTTADNHISKGMEITQNRLELIRKSMGLNIELRGPWQIQDELGNSKGTKVTILLPLNFHELFSDIVV